MIDSAFYQSRRNARNIVICSPMIASDVMTFAKVFSYKINTGISLLVMGLRSETSIKNVFLMDIIMK